MHEIHSTLGNRNEFKLIYNPLLVSNTDDLHHPPCVLIGTDDDNFCIVYSIWRKVFEGASPMIVMSWEEAEMASMLSVAYLKTVKKFLDDSEEMCERADVKAGRVLSFLGMVTSQ